MEQLIEKYAMQCSSWPYWRGLPNDTQQPTEFIATWPEHYTEEQKQFWRNFVRSLINDIEDGVTVVDSSKLDTIIELLNK